MYLRQQDRFQPCIWPFELAANKAHVCFIGTPHVDLSFTPAQWENMNRKEFKLTGSWMSYSAPFPGKEWELTAHYFATGQLKFDPGFIYKKIPMSQAQEAFQLFKTPGLVKRKDSFYQTRKTKMILTVTLNAAIDKRYVVENFQVGEVNRVKECSYVPGGKGLNVSKPASIYGAEVVATGFVGGHAGNYIEDALKPFASKVNFIMWMRKAAPALISGTRQTMCRQNFWSRALLLQKNGF